MSINYNDNIIYWNTWGRQDPGGPHVGHMNFATCDCFETTHRDFDKVTDVLPTATKAFSWKKIDTVKTVCNDHLYDKIYHLWFIK